ncbi:LacI family DNA-binding transcriptional regulator [uncultured Sphaerochaeta sp.]|jgi:LacI family transcriptional regulator|uniref:LacI family DNA-binding transcriptional regulator n=1 Tax=uncultured Sphaerochaeta sp. TaxID=886478 RepID=UPI002A0A44CB|nr:LacI family DNA-binding transcriptional regulator [uncultured Sphaerochaeta sp.]
MSTIKDVARLANVSTCTVSRALSGKGYISENTKKSVLLAVEELNYQPNSIATELKAGVSNAIGLIVPDITNYYYMELASQIEKTANEMDLLIYLCNSNYDRNKEKEFVTELSNRKIRGIIVIPVSNEINHFLELQKKNIPFVFVNRAFSESMEFCIVENNYNAAYEIVEYLQSKRRKKISGIFQCFDNMIYRERYEGMKQALFDHGIYVDDSLIILNAEKENTSQRIEALFKKPDWPDAIFTSNDMLAFDVYQVLYKLDKKIPEDVMVIGFDDTLMAQKVYPPLTSYRMPIDIIAKKSVESILQGCLSSRNLPIIGRLIKRRSTGD